MKYTAQELKALTGKRTRAEGETALYNAFAHRVFKLGDRVYTLAGFDRNKNLVHFTAWWPGPSGGAVHSRLGLPLRLAVEGNGDLQRATVLH